MSETITEKAICDKCGVETRENTQFCYNCGKVLTAENPNATTNAPNGSDLQTDTETQAALDDLAEKLRADDSSGDKLAAASAERKRSRVGQRRSKKVVWEANDEVSSTLILLIAVLVAVIAAFVVFVTVTWK